jgi:hypothetical protein
LKINPFDYVKAVSSTKKDIMVDDISEKQYAPFLTNKSLSYHRDSIYFVQEMNTYHHLDNRLQFSFFLNTLRSKQRFSKWSKPYISKKIEVVKEYYKCNDNKAHEYVNILTDSQIKELKKRMNKGGTNNG